ncbi:SDR family NAD(P)-dependent oxidoreductase [Oceanicoccus sp. KOV_DT_Chl]|uniref:SDR family NAD(P)-dependent oxidoreductase n=1 Tax=Oceanicoccus sp. KOV_DT_Chl TaxID=1904639 RepID=UPI000C7E2F48|nr:SDR family NAD(P)-dependent oxidoreductase [Oceanicoccus sp. KOV_DT_Chl]
MKDFTNKVTVITGGASGVGRSLAFSFGRRGAKVVIADVDKAALETATADLKAEGIDVIGEFCDVTSQDSCNALAAKAQSHFGGIHLVFANAGIGAGEGGAMWDYSDKDWQWAFNVNMWGAIRCINAFMPILIAQNEEAHFVITGSGNGAFLIYPDQPVYTATKAAVQAITENLHYQVQAMDTPVKVAALFPGPHVVETGIFNSDRVRPKDMERVSNVPDSGIHSVEDMKRIMAEFDMELQTTHPDEVAEMAVKGIEQDKFWIRSMTADAENKMRARLEMILANETPVAQGLG